MSPNPPSPAPASVLLLGATGAVGGEVLATLLARPEPIQITTLGRRPAAVPPADRLHPYQVDVEAPATYEHLLVGQEAAICTLGVGQPSRVSPAEFTRIDRDLVLQFAVACRKAGVRHFQLLGAVGAHPRSRSLYLRTKGELRQALEALHFERLSLFQPSMILTPTNRYGWRQGLLLRVWPRLDPLFAGPLRKFRGIPVGTLGRAMALNLFRPGPATEVLEWADFMGLGETPEG